MPSTGTKIQTWVRIWANDRTLSLSTGDGLEIMNEVYQGMFSPDYEILGVKIGRRRAGAYVEDDSLVTVASQEKYNWPVSPVFKQEPVIEIQGSTSSSTDYIPIPPADDEDLWRMLMNAGESFPSHYRRGADTSGTVILYIRPLPNTAGLKIRIRGQQEISEFTTTTAADGTTLTAFAEVSPDRALAKFIAAIFKAKRNARRRADELVQEGVGLLADTDYMPAQSDNEITPHYL